MANLTGKYSNPIINQNQRPTLETDWVTVSNSWYYQTFLLPSNIRRGTRSDETRYPELSGYQILVSIADGYADSATLDYVLQTDVFGVGWVTYAEGTAIGAHADGPKVWFDIIFDQPVELTMQLAGQRWRIGFSGRSSSNADHNILVPYDGERANVEGTAVEAKLIEGIPFPFILNGIPSFLYLPYGDAEPFYSVQQGVIAAWYSVPNPLSSTFDKAYQANGTTAITRGGEEVSFCFRLLGLVADEGTDFLGNQYRSVVVVNSPANAHPDATNKYYLSEPAPSRFAVKSLYYDISNNGPGVFDSISLGTTTPGVFCSIYYSSEGDPGTSTSEWEQKLWTRSPTTIKMLGTQTYTLAAPIAAKYIKLEFSHLQAQSYSPGSNQPVTYKKHPKWVLDYFLAQVNPPASTDFVANRVGIIYDTLNLAYNYYLDDIQQDSANIRTASVPSAFRSFLTTNASGQVDQTTLDNINTLISTYQTNPIFAGTNTSLLADQVKAQRSGVYPVESLPASFAPIRTVSTPNRDAVVNDLNWPLMYFYLTCRHTYRELQAKFEHNRAYFVGLQQVAFLRNRYNVSSDTEIYMDSASDFTNVELNDFEIDGDSFVVELSPAERVGNL
jgi:hypothetical protein